MDLACALLGPVNIVDAVPTDHNLFAPAPWLRLRRFRFQSLSVLIQRHQSLLPLNAEVPHDVKVVQKRWARVDLPTRDSNWFELLVLEKAELLTLVQDGGVSDVDLLWFLRHKHRRSEHHRYWFYSSRGRVVRVRFLRWGNGAH